MSQNLGDRITRRTMLKRAGAGAAMLTVPALLSACGGDDEPAGTDAAAGEGESPELAELLDSIKSDRVIVATYGGGSEEVRREVFWDPFTERTGVRVVTPEITGTLGDDQLNGKARARWDAFHVGSYQVLYAQENGSKPLVKVPMPEELTPTYARDYMWQSFLVGACAGNVKGTFGTQPATPADFFDLKKFPGKRAWPAAGPNVDSVKEWALLADGVSPGELYPLDLERANAKIESIWDELVFYEAFPQILTFLTSETVSIAWGPNGIFKRLGDEGVDVNIIWDGAITTWNGEPIIPDAPNMDAVMALSAWCNDPARQAAFSEATGYGPPSRAAFDKLPEQMRAQLPNSPGLNTVPINDHYYLENFDEVYADNQRLFERH